MVRNTLSVQYKDPIIEKILDVLRAQGPTKLRKRYVNGDVLLPSRSELPMAYLAKDQVQDAPVNNMEDEDTQLFVLTVILDYTQDLTQAQNIVAGTSELYEFCEKRTPDYRLTPDSLLYILRTSQQIDDKFWLGVGTPVQINYGLGVERRGPNVFSVEATVRFTARLHLPTLGTPIQ